MSVRVLAHPDASRLGEALIVFPALECVPDDVTLRIEPVDRKMPPCAMSAEPKKGWPSGEIRPTSVEITDRGVEFCVGPEVVDAPALQPGMPVSIVVSALGSRSDVIWPSLRRSLSKRADLRANGSVIGPTVRRRDAGTTMLNGAKGMKKGSGDKASSSPQQKVELKSRSAKPLEEFRASTGASGEAVPDRDKSVPPAPLSMANEVAALEDQLARLTRKFEEAVTVDREARPPKLPGSQTHQTSKPPSTTPATKASSEMLLSPKLSLSGDAKPKILAKLDPPARPLSAETRLKAYRDARSEPAPTPRRGPNRMFVAFLTGMAIAIMSVAALLVLAPDLRSIAGDGAGNAGELLALPHQSLLGETSTGVDIDTVLSRADHHLGLGGPESRREAKYWLGLAVAKGIEDKRVTWALTQLGALYAQSDHAAPDYRAARLFWNIAASAGDPVAMCFLGRLSYRGVGAPRDTGKALYWFTRARQAGACAEAETALAKLSK